MLRWVMVLFVGLVVVAILSGNPRTRRVLWVLAGLAILYTVLKLTGVIDAMAPDRAGVF
jgi:uncharacterized membrane protein YuzA (DUF378 family)